MVPLPSPWDGNGFPDRRTLAAFLICYRDRRFNLPSAADTFIKQFDGVTDVWQIDDNGGRAVGGFGFRDDTRLWVFLDGTRTYWNWTGNVLGSLATISTPHGRACYYFAEAASSVYQQLVEHWPGWGGDQINLYGHSLGGAAAILLAERIQNSGYPNPVNVVASGSPRVYVSFNQPATVRYGRVWVEGDPVVVLPVRGQTIYSLASNGLFGPNRDYDDFGDGFLLRPQGSLSRSDPPIFANSVQAIPGSFETAFHAVDTYLSYLKMGQQGAELVTWLNSLAPAVQISGTVDTGGGGGDWSFVEPHVPPAAINDEEFSGQAVVSPQTETLIPVAPGDADIVLVRPGLTASFISGGGGVANTLYKVQIRYRFNDYSWTEQFWCSTDQGIDAVVFKFQNANSWGKLLQFRPANCLVHSVRASAWPNARLGRSKIFRQTAASNFDKPDQVNTCILTTQKNISGKRVTREIRCWGDQLLDEDNAGNLLQLGAVQGYLNQYADCMKAAPAFGSAPGSLAGGGVPQPRYPVLTVTDTTRGTSLIGLSAADFAAIKPATGPLFLIVGGQNPRALTGIKGQYQSISLNTPQIEVFYQFPAGVGAGVPTGGMWVRAYSPSIDQIDTLTYVDHRARDTWNPIDHIRGRGKKGKTRRGL